MSLDASPHYNSKPGTPGSSISPNMPTNQERPQSSKSPHSSQNFPFASKFANPMFPYAQSFPSPGYFSGLYPPPEYGFLAKTPPLSSQMAPMPPFPMARPLTPPAAMKPPIDKYAFEPDDVESKEEGIPLPTTSKSEEEIIEEEAAEDEFQKNFVEALRKSGRLETAEKVIKARQIQLEERGRGKRTGQSPGASSLCSDSEDGLKDEVPDWFNKAREEVEKERNVSQDKADHFERQMARFGLGKPKEASTKPLELPPPYDKLDLAKKDEEGLHNKKEDDAKLVIDEPKEQPKMSALDDVLNDVIAQSREMTESKEAEDVKPPDTVEPREASSPRRDSMDSSRDEESRDYDMHMATVEDAPETSESRDNKLPAYPSSQSYGPLNQMTPFGMMRPNLFGPLGLNYPLKGEHSQSDGRFPTSLASDYSLHREASLMRPEHSTPIKDEHSTTNRDSYSMDQDQRRSDSPSKSDVEPCKPPSQDLELFRAMGLKSDAEMEDFHKMMAMKARQMMMNDRKELESKAESSQPSHNPFAIPGLGPLSSTALPTSFPSSLSSLPPGSLATTLSTGLPPNFSAGLMDVPRGRDEANPMFPGLGSDMMPFMMSSTIVGDDNKDIFFCHLCSYTGTSKFHFNAHMNTHFEHRCPHCDYTSRTEGRLKRHIKDFHIDSNGQQTNVQKTTMRNNTPGRPKVYRCKQCEFVANTKVEFWVHARIHIKEEKVLQCPKCPFVTEYKHHLEYHLRNHFGSKPFKCSKCNYSCVNKSMLNSHMKSHTNVYQYRCADCTYATKYCHSLKLHLRKYNHKPATILNSDGSLPLDDNKAQTELMKNRDRGPRIIPKPGAMKRLDMEPPKVGGPENGLPPRLPGMNGAMVPPMYWPVLNNGLPQLPPPLLPVTNMIPIPSQLDRGLGRLQMDIPSNNNNPHRCRLCCFDADDKESLNKHMLKVHAAENQDLFNAFGITSDSLEDEVRHNGNGDESHARGSPPSAEKGALDLSKPVDLSRPQDSAYNHRKRRLLEHCLSPAPKELAEKPQETTTQQEVATPPRKRSRKGKAFKLDANTIRMQEDGYTSPGIDEEYDRSEDYGYGGEELKDEDSQKVPDFNEVHENLRKLNQNCNERFVYNDDKSPFQRLNALTNSIDAYKTEERASGEYKSESPMEKSDSPAYVKPESPYKSESPYKLDSPRQPSQNGGLSDNDDSSSGRDAMSPDTMMNLPNGHNINIKGDFFECQYCEIAFKDCVLYTMHMGYHGYKDAFHCNNCGYQGKDKVDFFLHIARIAHV